MKLDHDGALTRDCEWCRATSGEECWHLNGDAPQVQSRPFHAVRLWVWEESDMTAPCGYCGAAVQEPCRTVGDGYPRTSIALHPHAIRLARSREADTPHGRTHLRDLTRPHLALCGVLVTAWEGGPHVACRSCRQIDAHREFLAGLKYRDTPTAG